MPCNCTCYVFAVQSANGEVVNRSRYDEVFTEVDHRRGREDESTRGRQLQYVYMQVSISVVRYGSMYLCYRQILSKYIHGRRGLRVRVEEAFRIHCSCSISSAAVVEQCQLLKRRRRYERAAQRSQREVNQRAVQYNMNTVENSYVLTYLNPRLWKAPLQPSCTMNIHTV